jgi:hypothetical protein
VSGASHPSRLPSGEILGLVRSGLPSRTSLGMSGGSSPRADDDEIGIAIAIAASKTAICRMSMIIDHMSMIIDHGMPEKVAR